MICIRNPHADGGHSPLDLDSTREIATRPGGLTLARELRAVEALERMLRGGIELFAYTGKYGSNAIGSNAWSRLYWIEPANSSEGSIYFWDGNARGTPELDDDMPMAYVPGAPQRMWIKLYHDAFEWVRDELDAGRNVWVCCDKWGRYQPGHPAEWRQLHKTPTPKRPIGFAVGDVVKLKSGGPAMVIASVLGGKADVVWQDEDGSSYSNEFPLVCLKRGGA